MQLREHPSVMGRWPPNSGGISANRDKVPADCLDTLVAAHLIDNPELGLPGIALETTICKHNYVRQFFIYDKLFAKALCKFLKAHTGDTIRAIGELDVTSETVLYATAGVSERSRGKS